MISVLGSPEIADSTGIFQSKMGMKYYGFLIDPVKGKCVIIM